MLHNFRVLVKVAQLRLSVEQLNLNDKLRVYKEVLISFSEKISVMTTERYKNYDKYSIRSFLLVLFLVSD